MNIDKALSEKMDLLWIEENEAFGNLTKLRGQSPQEIYGNLWDNAFAKQPKAVVCIDERVHLNDPTEPEIGIAGTLVLMNDTEFATTIDKLKKAGVDEVTYHEGCGAAALYKQQSGDNLEVIEVAKNAAEKVRTALGLTCELELCGYSPESHLQMVGDARFHNARAIVVDGTGKFNPALLGFPSHFLLSAFYEPNLEYTAKELNVAIGIALGDHGFGREKFAQAPLAIVLVGGEGEYSLDNMKQAFAGVIEVNQGLIEVFEL